MRAVYKGAVYVVLNDGDAGVQLERLADLGADPYVITVPFSDPDLILDPTDDEVEEASE